MKHEANMSAKPKIADYCFKIVVMGPPFSGKSCIIKRYAKGFFQPRYMQTFSVDYALKDLTKDHKKIRLMFWDIQGIWIKLQHLPDMNTYLFYQAAAAALLCFDVTRQPSFEAIEMWKKDLDSKVCLPNGKPIPALLLANKCDLNNEFDYKQLDKFCQRMNFLTWFKCSAKENIGIDEALDTLVTEVMAHEDMMVKDPKEGFYLLQAISISKPERSNEASAVSARASSEIQDEQTAIQGQQRAEAKGENVQRALGEDVESAGPSESSRGVSAVERPAEADSEVEHFKQLAVTERNEKRAVIAKLEVTVKELNSCSEVNTQLKAEKTEIQGQLEYYKNLSQQFEQQLQHTAQLYQQSQLELGQSTHAKSILTKQLERAQRVQEQLDQRLLRAQTHIQERPPPQRIDQHLLDPYVLNPKQPIRFNKKIGQGCFGSVYAVEIDGKSCIAKRLLDILVGRDHEEPVGDDEKDPLHQKFLSECYLLSQMNHANIVQFIGVHYGQNKYDLALLMERLATDLQKYLKMNQDVSFAIKASILYDVSCGLLYLHQHSVIHRDLSAANILLTTSLHAKIADLGVSRIIDRSLFELTGVPGALAYMPPEALKDRSVYNESLDIFSYGVIALFAAIQEFPEYSHDRVPDAVDRRREGEIYKRRVWIEKMETRQPELCSLVLWCLRDDPTCRPSTECLNILLQELHKDYCTESRGQ